MEDLILDLLIGSYDLHTHSSPSHVKRSIDDIDLIKEANKYNMSGVMIKNHYESTIGRAQLINSHFNFNTKAYGGIALNYPVGGLNPYACESSLKLGGVFIWFPTRDSENSLKYGNMKGDFFSRKGISILNDKGKLKKEVYEIIEVVKKYNAVIATGHLSVEESIILCEESIKNKVKTVLTHPDWLRTDIDIGTQLMLAKKGVILEKVWANLEDGDCSKNKFLNVMRNLDYENIFISTDRGIYNKKTPINSMKDAIKFCLESGIEIKNIEKMIKFTPKNLVEG
ncbi:DUF6282 family protein [Peptoniphilus indolicus]|nr:DUF6282 family protein [Peptoniphilus indolicus]SUB75649.1 Uncharacterised protein [Peptoniphilus indolicus]